MNWNLVDERWTQRHDSVQFGEMENALDKALYNTVGRAEYPLLWRWARMSHFRAMMALEEGRAAGAAGRHFAAGAEEAFTSTELQPNRVEGHFWHGVCLIEAARQQGKLAALRALPLVDKELERAAKIDENYHFAGPLRVQARMAHLKPKFLGGSLARALDLYRRALAIAPGNSTTLLYYAEALAANRDKETARTVLNEIMEGPVDEAWVWEQARDKRLAADKLAGLA